MAEKAEGAAWPRRLAALALMTLAGLRAGKAFAVTADRLDTRAGRLLVDRHLTEFGGLGMTMAGESRTVGLVPQLVTLLRDLSHGKAAERVVRLDGEALSPARSPGTLPTGAWTP
jgi:hypothetical protein